MERSGSDGRDPDGTGGLRQALEPKDEPSRFHTELHVFRHQPGDDRDEPAGTATERDDARLRVWPCRSHLRERGTRVGAARDRAVSGSTTNAT